MQEGKVYALKMEIRSVASEALIEGRKYVVRIVKETGDKNIGPFQVTKKGELTIGEKVQFKIPGGELRRQSKCVIDVLEMQGTQSSKLSGRFQFLIMNYKNYSKNSFKLLDGQRVVGVIHMSINISSLQSQKNNERFESKTNQKSSKKQEKKVSIKEPEVQLVPHSESSQQIPPSINIRAPIQEIKLVCPSEAPRQPKSMFSAFDNSSIVILTKREVEGELKHRPQKIPLSSMGELFQKKKEEFAKEESVLKVPNENLIKSCRLSLSPSRIQKDSRYCKEIQQNLDNLSALDQQSNRLSCSRSPLKGQQDFSIFDTLHRMKDKFQKIHQHEGFLNDEPLDELTEVNQDETQEKEKLLQSENSKYYPMENLSRKVRSEQEPFLQLGKSTIINLEVHSAVSHLAESEQNCISHCRIIKTVDLYFPPQKPSLRITACPNLQLSLNPTYQLHIPMRETPLNKRYRLAMTNNANVSAFDAGREETEALKQPPTLSQSYLNFQIEEQSLQRVSYIKLNKISHLSRAADISKRRNNFLIKANEELKVAKRLAQQKLDVSKKIISEKEELLTHEFDVLREHMRIISANLSLKNQQSIKREEKVKSLQIMVEQYVRDINSLKEDLRAKQTTIKELKALLSLKEETESKASKREDQFANRNIREAMRQQLGISKNIIDFLMEGGRQNELSISKNYKEPGIFTKKEDLSRRGGDLLAQIFQSQQRQNSSNKTFIQERKVRKYSSIQNTVNNINIEQQVDKSADLSSRTFRKFSHSKNSSAHAIEPQKQKGKVNTNMDLVFEKLTGLFSGDSNGRVLKNL